MSLPCRVLYVARHCPLTGPPLFSSFASLSIIPYSKLWSRQRDVWRRQNNHMHSKTGYQLLYKPSQSIAQSQAMQSCIIISFLSSLSIESLVPFHRSSHFQFVSSSSASQHRKRVIILPKAPAKPKHAATTTTSTVRPSSHLSCHAQSSSQCFP